MSLNGLDVPAVQEAYATAITEAGGWFFLKYTSRDTVELLSRGRNGVHEARNAIANYEEQSPLYGCIIYRRRKVLIKYIPEGTSRLLQARTAVHFQDVAERYSPYETLLEITLADELSDTSLAASFPLHTASPAASSQRLHEISEDGEDPGSLPRPKPPRGKSSTGSIFGTRQYKMEKRVEQLMRTEQRPTPSIQVNGDSTPTVSSPLAGGAKSSVAQFLVRDDSGKRSVSSLASPPSIASFTESATSSAGSDTSATTAKETETTPSVAELPRSAEPAEEGASREEAEEPAAPSLAPLSPATSRERPATAVARNPSMTSERSVERPSMTSDASSFSERPPKPSIDEPYDFSYLEPKPKVKLGPRPVAASEPRARRSQGAGISALPAGYRPASKKSEQQRPKSQGPVNYNHAQMLSNMPAPPPIPDTPEYNPRPLSRGSVKSLPSAKSTTMTPEKLRLMKAVELRKKQLRKSSPQPEKLAQKLEESAPAVPAIPGKSERERPREPAKLIDAVSAALEQDQPQNKSDSGIEMEYSGGADKERADALSKLDAQNTHSAASETQQNSDDSGRALEAPAVQAAEARDTAHCPTSKPESTSRSANLLSQPQSSSARETLRIDTSRTPSPKPEKHDVQETEEVRPVTARHIKNTESVDSPTLGRDVDIPAISSSLDHLITDVPTFVTTAPSRPPTADGPEARANIEETAQSKSEDSNVPSSMKNSGTLPLPGQQTANHGSDLAKRRRGIVEPLHIDVEKDLGAEGETGTDDELYEELQSATLHEAQPMSVSRSPGPNAQFFARRPSNNSGRSLRSQTESPQVNNTSNGVSHNVRESSPEQSREQPARETSSASPEPETQPYPAQSTRSSNATPTYESGDPMANLRRNVSSGISSRWKALSEQSTRESSPVAVRQPTRPKTPEANLDDMIVTERKTLLRSPHSRTNSYRGYRTPQDRSSMSSTGFNQPEVVPIWSTTQDGTSNRDSISVKARIVRPAAASYEQQADEGAAPERQPLQESRIEINHNRGIPTPTPVSQAFLPPLDTTTPAPPPSKRDSIDHRTLHSASSRRKSWGRTKNVVPIPPPTEEMPAFSPKTMSSSGAASIVSDDTATTVGGGGGGGSRTSRFFKRMSNFGNSNKRRSVAAQSVGSINSPTLCAATVRRLFEFPKLLMRFFKRMSNFGNSNKRRSVAAQSVGSINSPTLVDLAATGTPRNGSVAPAAAEKTDAGRDRSDMPPAVAVGDLNVQFPDTLLWKRRSLTLSADGHILFSLPSNNSSSSRPPSSTLDSITAANAKGLKRYPLSDFKAPYTPDLDRQELAHSICLEFVSGEAGGTVLQVACEDAMGQRQVLRLLGGYWKSWVG